MTDPVAKGPAVRTQPDAGQPALSSAAQGNVRAAPASTHVPRELLSLLQLGRRARAAESVAALEGLRLDLLRVHAGAADLQPLTTLMDAARQIGDDLGRLAEAQDEVQRATRGRLLSPPTPT